MFKKYALALVILSSAKLCADTDMFVEAKAAYFHPEDKTFRNIYSGGGIYGLELSVQTWRGLYVWTGADYFHKSGRSIGEDDRTTITFVPIGLGLKYLFPVRFVDFYLGGGALGTYAHFRDHSRYVIQHISRWGAGGIAKAGILLNSKHFFIDLFTNYSFMKIHFHDTHHGKLVRHPADLSGWSFGAGIGYRLGRVNKEKHKKKT